MGFIIEINKDWTEHDGQDQSRRQEIAKVLTKVDLSQSDRQGLMGQLEDALRRDEFKAPGVDSRPPMAKPYGLRGIEVRDYGNNPITIAKYLPQ